MPRSTQAVDASCSTSCSPAGTGWTSFANLRASGFAKPILILTALDAVEERVQGLDSGANDYLVKPFAFAELLARLRALLRRDFSERELVLRADDLEMDLLARRVTRCGVELELTGREYELLEYLLRHKNEVVTRDMIARDVWKETTGAMTRIIDVYINALRKKVEQPGRPALDPDGARRRIRLEGRLVKRLSIRWRLTLWYGVVLSAILVGFSGAVYLLMRHHLLALTDAALAEELADLAGDVAALRETGRTFPGSSACATPATRATSSR